MRTVTVTEYCACDIRDSLILDYFRLLTSSAPPLPSKQNFHDGTSVTTANTVMHIYQCQGPPWDQFLPNI
ncbi:hypothetical protein RRG08_031259 [Elysia crispata]|uniref:Uncharacterized protein n=1 Tax=Elysia crispata TaxID=231223 RepID=A0AAE1AJ47_9GAST|nr:hypothetical protein RRG08_031259 [Elysia crispata]